MPEEIFVKISLSEENNRLNKLALEIARKVEAEKAAAKLRTGTGSSSIARQHESVPG